MQLPSAIIFVNYDLGVTAQLNLQSQLRITEILSEPEFDTRVAVDPNYPVIVHLSQQRILVLRSDFHDPFNRDLANIVLFIKGGLATVLKNNLGPPTLSLPTQRINIFNLMEGIKNASYSSLLSCRKCNCDCRCNCFKHLPLAIQDMLINKFDVSGVHTANCDNEFNNEAFINRDS